ncbi:Hypothetical predicted protein [Cloeon dipterum]|uniref:BTB domain-containing protein n=2 Tax=Cloeon dipterum TaxID=197152 RepID=A0A8S1DC71_9INSE|nr:Hypothetical predicted protein [Cloeon dipterum]
MPFHGRRFVKAQSKTVKGKKSATMLPETAGSFNFNFNLFGICSNDQNCGVSNLRNKKFQALEKGDLTDCVFAVGPEGELIHASKFDMSVASEVFEAMFISPLTLPGATIKLVESEPRIFKLMTEFIHTGSFKYGLRNCEDSVKLVLLADEYLVYPLIDFVIDIIEKHFLSVQTVWFILDNTAHIKKLLIICSKLIGVQTEECLDQLSFLTISKETLKLFLTFNEMNVNTEMVILRACLKIAQENEGSEKEYMEAALLHLRLLTLNKAEEIWEASDFLNEEQKNFLARKLFFKDIGVEMPNGLCDIDIPRSRTLMPPKGPLIVLTDDAITECPERNWVNVQNESFIFSFECCLSVKISSIVILFSPTAGYSSTLEASVKKKKAQGTATQNPETKNYACIVKSSEIPKLHDINFNECVLLDEGDTLEIELKCNSPYLKVPSILAKTTLYHIHSYNHPTMERLFKNFKFERMRYGSKSEPSLCLIKSIDYSLN